MKCLRFPIPQCPPTFFQIKQEKRNQAVPGNPCYFLETVPQKNCRWYLAFNH